MNDTLVGLVLCWPCLVLCSDVIWCSDTVGRFFLCSLLVLEYDTVDLFDLFLAVACGTVTFNGIVLCSFVAWACDMVGVFILCPDVRCSDVDDEDADIRARKDGGSHTDTTEIVGNDDSLIRGHDVCSKLSRHLHLLKRSLNAIIRLQGMIITDGKKL